MSPHFVGLKDVILNPRDLLTAKFLLVTNRREDPIQVGLKVTAPGFNALYSGSNECYFYIAYFTIAKTLYTFYTIISLA